MSSIGFIHDNDKYKQLYFTLTQAYSIPLLVEWFCVTNALHRSSRRSKGAATIGAL